MKPCSFLVAGLSVSDQQPLVESDHGLMSEIENIHGAFFGDFVEWCSDWSTWSVSFGEVSVRVFLPDSICEKDGLKGLYDFEGLGLLSPFELGFLYTYLLNFDNVVAIESNGGDKLAIVNAVHEVERFNFLLSKLNKEAVMRIKSAMGAFLID